MVLSPSQTQPKLRYASPPSMVYWVSFIGFLFILVLPLIHISPWFSPPSFGKAIIFRSVLAIIIFAFFCEFLFRKNQKSGESIKHIFLSQRKNISLWLLAALLLLFFLSTIFSLDRDLSLWGDPARAGGFVNFGGYVLFAFFVFLLVRPRHWETLWIVTIAVGGFVALLAILQQSFLLQDNISFVFISTDRSSSVVGGPTFLATYVLMLFFMAFWLGLREQVLSKKVFYMISCVLFFLAVIFTFTRAAYIGFLGGLFFFLMFYLKRFPWIKSFLFASLFIGVFGLVSAHPELIPEGTNPLFFRIIHRFVNAPSALAERFSVWQVSFQAIKEKPVLGYGPENFSIGFDRYYDPALISLELNLFDFVSDTTWWDRAHNFFFDIVLPVGIPAFLIYLALLGTLFWQLQKLKKTTPSLALPAHGLQTSFIAYLATNLFSFDNFSTYLIFFLMVGYTMRLIQKSQAQSDDWTKSKIRNTNPFFCWRIPIFITSLGLLIWFLWQYNLKPLQINAHINTAQYLVEHRQCDKALKNMEDGLAKGTTFLDAYIRIKYVAYLTDCAEQMPQRKFEFATRGYDLLKENIVIRPFYTRNWLSLGGFANVLMEAAQSEEPTDISRKRLEELKQEAYAYLEKARALSPKRQEVYLAWTQTDLISGDYQKAKEKTQKCIELNQNLSACWWMRGLAEIFLGNFQEGKEYTRIAIEKGYPGKSFFSYEQLAKAYGTAGNDDKLTDIFGKMTGLQQDDPQYHASLAAFYRDTLRQFDKAREHALKLFEVRPETKEMVEEFLKTLSPH